MTGLIYLPAQMALGSANNGLDCAFTKDKDKLQNSHLIFELKVAAGPLLGDEEEVVEEKEIPFLTLDALQERQT